MDNKELPEVGQKSAERRLQVTLAQYSTLRDEVLARSESQHQIVQLHVAALTVICGAMFVTELGAWALLLLPLEACLFGLWYFDHALTIAEISIYIHERSSRVVNRQAGAGTAFDWEEYYLDMGRLSSVARIILFRLTVLLTFVGPSVSGLAAALWFLLFRPAAFRLGLKSPLLRAMTPATLWVGLAVGTLFVVFVLISFSTLVALQKRQRELTARRLTDIGDV